MSIKRIIALALSLLAPAATAQDLTPKAPPQQRPILIDGATIHTITNGVIENGRVAIEDGVITAVTDADASISFGFDAPPITIDARGKHVYPGFIASATNLGLTEIGAVRATRDYNETGGFTPEVHPSVAINPDSTLIPVARSNGVLVAGVFPTGGRVPGRASVIRLDGWTNETMTIDDDAGLVVSFPRVRPVTDWWMTRPIKKQKQDIKENLDELNEHFASARAYLAASDADPSHPEDLRYEAMRSVFHPDLSGLDEQDPTFLWAQDLDQITAAVSFARRFDLRPVIVGGRDAPLVADLLIRHDIPVLVNGTQRFPKRADSPHDDPYTLPARLEAAGIRWAFASGAGASNERNLPYGIARAVAYGLDEHAAIRSITLAPAELLGVDDRLGSIEPGKNATLIITDGNPLEITTRVEHALINGRRTDLTNKQKQLNEKYRAKYRQLDLTEE